MRNIQTLISALKKLKDPIVLLKILDFRKTIQLYVGTDYKTLTTVIKSKNNDEITLFSTKDWSLYVYTTNLNRDFIMDFLKF